MFLFCTLVIIHISEDHFLYDMPIFAITVEISSILSDYYIGRCKGMHTNDPNVQELEQTIMKYKRTVYGIAMPS